MQEFDLIVIGAGPAGYVAAIRAAQAGLNVACVESRGALGGTCLNVGCIPSKVLLNDSEMYHQILHDTKKRGIIIAKPKLDLTTMMAHKTGIVQSLTDGIAFLFKKNNITALNGHASFKDANIITVSGDDGAEQDVKAAKFLIATGSNSVDLPFAPCDEKTIVSSTGALSFDAVPKHLVVVGAGVIGLELGSVWSRLGAKVTVVEFLDHILPGLDHDLQKSVQKSLEKQGIEFILNHQVTAIDGGKIIMEHRKDGSENTLKADKILVAIGRKPNTDGLGLDIIGVQQDDRGFISVNDRFETNIAGIYAIGDVIGGMMLAHKAEDEAVAAVNLIAGKAAHINYAKVPSVVYISPEVAQVGLTEEEAKQAGLELLVGKFNMAANSRAKAIDHPEGFVKMIADKKTKRLLGCQVFSVGAGDIIQEAVLLMEQGRSLEEIAYSCHSHPGLGEAMKEAALATLEKPIHA